MAPELGSRRRIYQIVRQHPGIHFRDLLARAGLAHGTLQHHLDRLQDAGLVTASQDGRFTRYHAKGQLGAEDRHVMDALRREYGRRVLAYLATEGPMTTSELSGRLRKAPSTVSWHLARLAEAGLVTRRREGKEVRYEVVDAARVVHLCTVFRGSLTDRLVDRLIGLWDEA